MSRNRYTKLVRKSERSQIVRQEKELTVIRRKLRQDAKPTAVLLADEAKECRSARLEQKMRHKARHRGDAIGIDQK